MKLLSLRMEPTGPTGWSSETLVFGDHITQLFGPNGCGKTPIIQSMAHVLGHPVKFREDVLKNCSAAVLRIQSSAGDVELRRKLGTPFEAQINRVASEPQTFYVEKDYSNALLAIFGITPPTPIFRLLGRPLAISPAQPHTPASSGPRRSALQSHV